MQKIIKWVLLFLVLGLPVCIYVFLRTFGVNKFEIPIFYQNGIDNRVEGCNETSGQYLLPSIHDFDTAIDANIEGAVLYNIGTVAKKDQLNKSNNLILLEEKLDSWQSLNYQVINLKSEELLEFYRCGLNLNATFSEDSLIINNLLVLIDEQRRIRGYYDVLERKEMDRLIIEIDILINE